MRSSCTGGMTVEAATPSWQRPLPREPSLGTSPPSPGRGPLPTRSTSLVALTPSFTMQASAIANRGEWKRSPGSHHLRRQCARALHSDGADRKAGSTRLCQLRHAPRRASAHGRSALDQARLERLVGLRGEQALRRPARLCRRSPLEGRQIQRAGAWVGADKDGRPFSPGRSSAKAVSPKRGSPRAKTSWRNRPAGISIINALVRRTRSPTMSGFRRSCSQSAAASAVSL